MIPWWGKLVAKIFLSRLPFGYAVWQKLGLFRHGSMDSADYALRVFNERAEKAGVLHLLHGQRFLELGPGDSIGSAIIAASIGAEAVIVDAAPFARDDVEFYIGYANTLRDKGLSAPELEDYTNVDEILLACRSQYMTEGLASLRLLPDNSIDYIFRRRYLSMFANMSFWRRCKNFGEFLSLVGCVITR